MSTANIDLYEVLKGLGVDPSRAHAASISSNESAWRDFDSRLRELAADMPTLHATLTTRFDGLDTRLRVVEEGVAGLKVLARVVAAGVGAILLMVAGVAVKVFLA